MISVDEFGPLELRPCHGRSWQRQRKPARLRATYTRPHGVRHMLSAYDVGTGKLWGHVRPRKRWGEFLTLLRSIRRRYEGRIWVILDNFSPHLKAEVLQWVRQNDMELVFLPTNASWLNPIECEFTSLKKSVLTHCDYSSHEEMRLAIHRWLRWRNRNNRIQLSQKGH